jgi:hypothetical protein
MNKRLARVLLVASMTTGLLGGVGVAAHAGTFCWYQGIDPTHTGTGSGWPYCPPVDNPTGNLNLRTQETQVSTWGNVGDTTVGTTGVGWSDNPTNLRYWTNGQEHYINDIPDPPPLGQVCLYQGIDPLGNGTGAGWPYCPPVPVPGASANVRTQTNNVNVNGNVAGVPVGDTGVVWTNPTDPGVKVAGVPVL